MRSLAKAGAIFDRINEFMFWLAAAMVIFANFAICYDVGMRYFLNKPTTWAIELTENIQVWFTFFAAAWVLKREGHIKIDFIVSRLRPRTQAMLNLVNYVLCATACLVVTWYSGQVVWEQFQTGVHTHSYMHLLMWPIYIVLPIGFFLLFVQFLRNANRYLSEWKIGLGKSS